MQIREKGHRIQLVRAEYIPAERTPEGHLRRGTGRAKPYLAGTFDKYIDYIPETLQTGRKKTDTTPTKEVLSKDELTMLQKWLDDRKEKRQAENIRMNISFMPTRIKDIAGSLPEIDITENQVNEWYEAIDLIQKAFRKKGYSRPKKEAASHGKKEGEADSKTMKMFD